MRTNNNFPLGKSEQILKPNWLPHVKSWVDSVLKNEIQQKSQLRKKKEFWSKRRITCTILSTYREFLIRKNAWENIAFNTSFFLKYWSLDAKSLTKKNLWELAYKFFGDEIDNREKLANLDLEWLMKIALPTWAERDEILNVFEKGWSQKRIIKAIKGVYREYLEKKKSWEKATFNISFFAKSTIKDARNLTKKLKEFSAKALWKKASDLRNLIELVLPEWKEKDLILSDFKKRTR